MAFKLIYIMNVLFYLILISTLINFNLFEINAENSCKSIAECFSFKKFCFENECKCGPNYKLNPISGKCNYFNCSQDKECQEFDKNRKCLGLNKCICRDGYTENTNTKICEKLPLMCSNNSVCQGFGNTHQVCVDNVCQCVPNYKWDLTHERCINFDCNFDGDSVYCSYFSCSYDSECQTYDKHRICNKRSCECETDYKEDSSSLKCTYNWSHEPNNNGRIWVMFFKIALVLFLIIGIGIGNYYYVTKKRKADSLQESNIRFHCNPQIIQQNPNLPIISHNVSIDDPPPPYSTVE